MSNVTFKSRETTEKKIIGRVIRTYDSRREKGKGGKN